MRPHKKCEVSNFKHSLLKKEQTYSNLSLPLLRGYSPDPVRWIIARATARGGNKMLSDNKGVTERVKRMLFCRIGDRTLFDYLARPIGKAMNIETDQLLSSTRHLGGLVWLYNMYAVDVVKDCPDKFDAVFATRLPTTTKKARFGFVLVSMILSSKSPNLCYFDRHFEEIPILQFDPHEEEQMWTYLRRLTDEALVRVANYNHLLAVSSREVSAGDADLRMRRASAD